MVFGTFDLLHKGHLNFLSHARRYGELFVVVARDETVRDVKGITPVHDENRRLLEIEKSGLADHVLLGNHDDKFRVIEQVRPDLICLGYDQSSFTSNLEGELKRRGLKTRVIRLKPYMPHIYKSRYVRGRIGNQSLKSARPQP